MLSLSYIQMRMQKLKDWSVDSGIAIDKDFTFSSFKEAIDFVNKIADIAEKQQHHPDIMITMNNVRISLTTHYEKGLSEKDFDLAEAIDKVTEIEVKPIINEGEVVNENKLISEEKEKIDIGFK